MKKSDETVEVKRRMQRTRRLKMGQNKSQTDGSPVAAIRVSGIYLHDLGFLPNGFFDMTINEDGSLTLRAVSPEQAMADEEAKKSTRDSLQ